MLSNSSNICIINTAFLGDIILSSYLTQIIKNNYPECKISFITTQIGAELLKPIKSIDNLFIFDKRNNHKSIGSMKEFAKLLSNLDFDLLISLHKSFRTSLLVYLIKAKFKLGFKNSSFSIVYNKRIKAIQTKHEAEKYIQFFEFLNKSKEYLNDINIEIEISENDTNYVENLLLQNGLNIGDRFICIAPGSVWETKKWPKTYFNQLSDYFKNYKIVAIGSKKDSDLIDNEKIINLCGKTNFTETFKILKLAEGLITNDSAPTHFASIVNCPTLTIYGPTSPIFGFYPLSKKSKSLSAELDCSPCNIHGANKCPLDTHECMNSLMPEKISQEMIKIIEPSQQ